MKKQLTAATLLTLAFGAAAIADTGAQAQAAAAIPAPAAAVSKSDVSKTVQRDVNQQGRIEQGLKDGSLTTREASRLEKEEARVERTETRDLKDGRLSAAEREQLKARQNKLSRDIHKEKNNAGTGNPDSAGAGRLQSEVQRNVNQQARIEQGIKRGELSDREAGRLEKGQARDTAMEARAAADGHVGAGEHKRIQTAENSQGRHIHHEKHDAVKK